MAAWATSQTGQGGIALAGSYPQVGGGPAHLGVAAGPGPASLAQARFVVNEVEWLSQVGLVVGLGKVVGLADNALDPGVFEPVAVAVDERTGCIAWRTAIPPPELDSWAWPAIDEQTGAVLVASGDRLTALDISDGHVRWQMPTQAGKPFVNACPTVAEGNVYVADYSWTSSTLYAVRIDTGQVLWQVPVGLVLGANTAAVLGDKVLLVTRTGRFRTFDTVTGAAGVDVLIDATGFFGGVAAEAGAAYAVTYNFGGASRLYKINPATGGVIWWAPAPRTDAIPVLLDDRVIVSGGDGYGDVPGLYAYSKATGQMLWSTPLAGCWTSLPVCAGGVLYAATFPGKDSWDPGQVLAFDLSKQPGEAGFVVDSTASIGYSPVVANGNLYGTGWDGLAAYGPVPRIPGDVDGNGTVDIFDVIDVISAFGSAPGDPNWNPDADFDGNGMVDIFDVITVVTNFGATG